MVLLVMLLTHSYSFVNYYFLLYIGMLMFGFIVEAIMPWNLIAIICSPSIITVLAKVFQAL